MKRKLPLRALLAVAGAALVVSLPNAFGSVWTDQADYAPGSVVTISGDNSNSAGYIAGETVHVAVSGPNGYASSCEGVADDSGAWSCQVTLNGDDSAVGSYSYTATGQSSGVSESGAFTDAPIGSGSLCANVSGHGSAICGDLSSANVSTFTGSPTRYAQLAGTSADYRIAGATDAVDANGDHCLEVQVFWVLHGTSSLCATPSGNDLNFTFRAPSDGCNATIISYESKNNQTGTQQFRDSRNDIIDDGVLNASGTVSAGIGFANSSGDLVQCDRMTSTSTTVYDDATGNPVSGPLTAPASAHDQATVTSTHIGLKGSVEFLFSTNGCDGPFTSIDTVPVNVSGNTAVVTSVSESNLGPGSYAFKAVFHGDDRFSDSIGDCEPFEVGRSPSGGPTISKDATGSYDDTYPWTIKKSVDKTIVKQVGGTATFNYTVTVSHGASAVSKVKVTGTITVNNPNSTDSVAITVVTDKLSDGTNCTVTGGGAQSLPPGSTTFPYECDLSGLPSGDLTNTATVAWNAQSLPNDGNLAAGSADFTTDPITFTANEIDECVSVSDPIDPNSPHTFCVGDPGDPTFSFQYSRTVNVPRSDCVSYDNTATFTTNDTGATGSASQTVKVCGPANTGGLTMGFWQNKNGQAIIKAGASTAGVCNSGTWLRQFNPFKDLSATANCNAVATYVYNVIKSGGTNCGGLTCNAMLKAQMLATALNVYFSDPALGGNKIGAPAPLGGVSIDLTKICTNIPTCTTFVNVSSAFGGATSLTVLQMLAYAASQSNSGGSIWYGQVKATQELAKDAFDAINNQVAFTA
jgi:hypothetical protein